MMNKSFFLVMIFAFVSNSYSQDSEIQYGLDIMNMVRENYSASELKFSKKLSEYALKKATQYAYGDEDEIIVSKEEVGLLYTIDEVDANEMSKDDKRIAISVLRLIDIDCDDGEDKYDLFNQVVDSDSKEVGVAEFYDKDKLVIVYVFDNYVYNQETDEN